jgi:hypothetical protein
VVDPAETRGLVAATLAAAAVGAPDWRTEPPRHPVDTW